MCLFAAVAAFAAPAPPDSTAPSLPEIRVVAQPAVRDSGGVYRLPEQRVEGARIERSPWAAPLATTVIDRRTIENSGALNVGEILRPVVGVRVMSLGGIGAFTPVSIRGSSNDQVVLLLDGRRLNAAQGGGVDLADLPLDNVERIEVIRGGASALYGPDALGGVINLITRTTDRVRAANLSGEVGSFGTRALSARLADGRGPVAWRLNGRLLDSAGDYPFDGADGSPTVRRNSRVDSRYLDGGLTLTPRWATRLDLRVSHYGADKGVPGSAQFPSPSATQSDEVTAADFELRGIAQAARAHLLAGPRTATTLSGFAERRRRRYQEPEHPLGPVDETHRNDAAGGSLRQTRDLGGAGLMVWGAEFRQDHLASSTDGDHRRPSRALYARDAVRAGRWTITPALRWDSVGDFPGRLSPKLLGRLALGGSGAADRPAGGGVELRGSFGRSFRPPSFTDLFLPARASAAGNPGLKPERAFDADLGLSAGGGAFEFGATLFYNRIADLIQWEPGAQGIWRPHNVPGARMAGAEIEASAALPIPALHRPAHLQANYTFLDPRDASDARNTGGEILPYRPRHRVNAQLRLPLGEVTAETQLRYTGPVYITRANTKTLPGYFTADLNMRWQVRPGASFELFLINLTGAGYQDLRDYPVPGRQWRLSANWNYAK